MKRQFDKHSQLRRVLCISCAYLLAGCGGGGGGTGTPPTSPPPPPPPPPPSTVAVSLSDATATEGDSGNVELVFDVALSSAASSIVSIDYATTDNTAVAGIDYVAATGSFEVPAGDTGGTITIAAIGDTEVENDEDFTLMLFNPSANVTLSNAAAVGTIQDDDIDTAPGPAAFLNDTGVTTCSNGATNELACNDSAVDTTNFPGQDAEFGRDVNANSDIDGHAGFIFTKLDQDGIALSDQAAQFDRVPWTCVSDEVSGLTWETKTEDGGRHDAAWTYSWYDNSGFATRAELGDPRFGACELDTGCDSSEFLARVNLTGHCGYNDWRLPTRSELMSIIHYGRPQAPLIDVAYFPNTVSVPYWSGTPTFVGGAWYVGMKSGNSQAEWFFNAHAVRLVRGESR